MRLCKACGCKNFSKNEVCDSCGKPLSLSESIFTQPCEMCSISRSKKVTIRGEEKSLCYECFNSLYAPSKGSHERSATEALYLHYVWLRQKAVYYGEDTTEIEKKIDKAYGYVLKEMVEKNKRSREK